MHAWMVSLQLEYENKKQKQFVPNINLSNDGKL